MGPRSHERGNPSLPHHVESIVSDKASMGPRSHERGNSAASIECVTSHGRAVLQWGRVLMNAETGHRADCLIRSAASGRFNGAAFS